jgi:glutaminase
MTKTSKATKDKSLSGQGHLDTSNSEHNFFASRDVFYSLDIDGDGKITKLDLVTALQEKGILQDDERIIYTTQRLASLTNEDVIDLSNFHEIISKNHTLVERALKGDLIIPDFIKFTQILTDIYEEVKPNDGGAVADYIPQLARVNPEYYSIAVCTVDGQRFSLGEDDIWYCVQSTCKPINYCIGLEEVGEEYVHNHVGREPSGRGFNELTLNKDGLPHNPMINAGAIMSCALVYRESPVSERFDQVMNFWQAMAGGVRPGFNNAVYLSERQTADRNYALGYFMREKHAFPPDTDLHEILEFYFQCCSIELTAKAHANVAATLANGGICPVTGDRVMSAETAKCCLSLMYSCGMYDFSGEFAFSVGLPAKSGVSGALVLVVPGVCGITIWSPRLDQYGNSVKAVEFSQRLVSKLNFHNYDSLVNDNSKHDPLLQKNDEKLKGVMAATYAASQGDLNEIKSLDAKGIDLDLADYDGRTPLHVAASEGHINIINYFINTKRNLVPKDRWSGTPMKDAEQHNHKEIVDLLQRNMMGDLI